MFRPSPSPVAALALVLSLVASVGLITVRSSAASFSAFTSNSDNSFQAAQSWHDVAVVAIRAPSTARINTTVTVEVDVENQGDYDETFDVVLRDVTKGTTIGTQTVSLAAGATTTVSFSWTADGPPGDHILEAEAVLAGDGDLSDNTQSITVQVTIF